MKFKSKTSLLFVACICLSACRAPRAPLTTAPHVELERFMGDWYVIANIPTWLERDAHNAVESYKLDADGTVATTFTFNEGGFDGPKKTYTPRGFVLDRNTNAVWGMRFIWPIKADYRIVYVDPSYTRTVVGREARDYVWIMARTPMLAPEDYQALLDIVKLEGYDISHVKQVPQRPDQSHARSTQ